jgi:predicted acyltransferase
MSQPAHDANDNVVLLKSGSGTAVRARESLLRGVEVREPPAPEAIRTLPAPASGRVTSVDALRGFAIFWILGGDGLAWSLQTMTVDKGGVVATVGAALARQFTHVPWEGFRFYDFIFPLFVFTTGVAIVLSLPRLVEHEGKAAAHKRVIRRFILLFLLGILYYGGVSKEWPDIRLLGVLQRIALCYLFASLLFLNLRPRDVVVAFATLLVGYWALMTFVPVPGTGAGSFARDANLANWIDLHYLPGMKWDGTWDPEGLLSTLPAIGTCLMGVFAGMLLTNPRIQDRQKSLWLIGAGIASLLAGYLWGLQFPVIKSIWTSSFVHVAGGYSLLLLRAMHQLIDVWRVKAWATIFIWIGANAITLYFLNSVTSFEQFATRFVGGDVGAFLDSVVTPGTGYLAAYAGGLVVAVALAGFLYRRKIFLRV